MGIGYRLQIQFITRKHRSGGGRVTPARRRRAEAPGPGARPARVGGLRPPLGGRASPGDPGLALGDWRERLPRVPGPARRLCSPPCRALVRRLPRAPQSRGAPRPLSSRENIPPARRSRQRGPALLGGKFWLSPRPRGPRRPPRPAARWPPPPPLPPRGGGRCPVRRGARVPGAGGERTPPSAPRCSVPSARPSPTLPGDLAARPENTSRESRPRAPGRSRDRTGRTAGPGIGIHS
ncbi:proline-rich protein HaeIII subfamily 1-like [Lynx rufus]|uniref:proline-rich protein HaeIII subfamily 1-like n=1 Tax=Lynx rufus TaxID=61384 RepID=UPI001F125341|nr:proline-rich protein HaeIII subfamily 1-like [Lynx rufus]